jgi:hypothetical protein
MNQASGSSPQPDCEDQDDEIPARRMYLFERGWKIRVKTGNEREFCHMMTPGQDYYHRLLDGEIFLASADERLCLACAARRGLLAFAPRRLRDAVRALPMDSDAIPLELYAPDDPPSSDW